VEKVWESLQQCEMVVEGPRETIEDRACPKVPPPLP
jgi:hypothetical protein